MTVGVAILGAGIFATDAHLPALAPLIASKEAALVAVYSRSAKTAQTFVDAAKNALSGPPEIPVYSDDSGADRNLDALLKREDVHAVVVVLPIPTQPDVIRKALAAGKHVLSEKPIAKDVATGIQLIKEVESAYSSSVLWRVAENFEAEPSYLRARQAVADGSIGELVMFNLSTVNFLDQSGKYYKTPWRTVPEYQGGFLLDGGVHSAAIVRLILGEKHALESLSGHATLTKEYLAPHDTIQAVFRTRAGATGIFELSFAAPQASRAGTLITITGTKGWIKIEPIKIEVDGALKPGNRVTLHKLVDGNKEETQSWEERIVGVPNEYASFIAAISSKQAAKTKIGDFLIGQPRAALNDVALIQAALTSNGKQVLFDELLHGL